MEKLNFSDCTLAIMEETFGLIPADSSEKLSEWTSTTHELDDLDRAIVARFCNTLQQNVSHWNEFDLSLHFIGPMFSLVSFTEKRRFNLFAQRNLEAEVQGIKIMGRVDEVIASGYRVPKIPFFAFNEYKKETDPDGDPAGQALAAMLVGQQQNLQKSVDLPLYGCYIIGATWRFMILEDNKYAMSKRFDGAEYEDALQILRILSQLKVYCMERTEAV